MKMRKELQARPVSKFAGLFFDRRKDKTRAQTRRGRRQHTRWVMEEHIVLVSEPNSVYLGHVTPSSGDAKSIAKCIAEFLQRRNIASENIVALGCDGAAVNTGAVKGVVHLLEKEFGRPLQRLVCLLHFNELPLRHLMQKTDGVTSGPKAFTGVIGKALATCEQLPVIKYNPISFDNCPSLHDVELSNDQKYLYDMCTAVSTGNCSESLAVMKPGPLVHSRWLTTANRLLRLYVSSESPSDSLTDLVTYVVKVYAPVWFQIKVFWACSEGARHVWQLIKYSRYLKPELRSIMDEVMQRNGYFCHSENLLLAMAMDSRPHIRELACRRILAARRETAAGSGNIRAFRIPDINFEADDYVDLVDWSSIERSDPPLMKHISDEKLMALVTSGVVEDDLQIPQLPCHTQSTERCIRLVIEASVAVCGERQRDGFIQAGIESRATVKTFNTKSDYKLK